MSSVLLSVQFAFRAIRRNAVRASLTVTGIVIAVAAMTITASVGAGAREEVAAQYAKLGNNLLFVTAENGGGSAAGAKASARLTEGDAAAIARDIPLIAEVAVSLRVKVRAVVGERNTDTMAYGATRSLLTVKNMSFSAGSWWSETDDARKARVCVIGETVREKLFPEVDPIGRTIRVGRRGYRVVGVAAKLGYSPSGQDRDDNIWMPMGAVRGKLIRVAAGAVESIQMSAKSAEVSDPAEAQVVALLRERHHIAVGAPPDFRMRNQAQLAESEGRSYDMLTALLTAVAAISLIVGGVGVTNVLLVSVAERRREIGICLAIGAGGGEIAIQFLVEAVVLSILGGLGGVVVGLGGSLVVAEAYDWTPHFSVPAIIVGLLSSATTGLVFGFLPAFRASRLDPIQALRHD